MELQTFASGDTDYIAKLNHNVSELTEAIEGLNVQMGAMSGGDALSVGLFMDALFNRADALIGPESYKPTKSASTLTISPGGMYLTAEHAVVMSNTTVNLSFVGQVAGTHYIAVNASGQPARFTTQQAGTVYSVYWSGSAFGTITYVAAVFFDTMEADRARRSAALATVYTSLDARLEAGEAVAVKARDDAGLALDIAYDLQAAVGGVSIRKIGITVDGTTGVKGAIQIDFEGVIIGWSCIADVPGILQVEISKKASSQPPAAPAIPNPTTDKITASAPIALASQQSASRNESGISTWTRDLYKWDVVQFNVVSVSAIAHATMYLRIQENLPSPPEINPMLEGDA